MSLSHICSGCSTNWHVLQQRLLHCLHPAVSGFQTALCADALRLNSPVTLCIPGLQVYLGWLCGADVVHHSRHHTGRRPHTRAQPCHEGVLLLHPCFYLDLHSEARKEQRHSLGLDAATLLPLRRYAQAAQGSAMPEAVRGSP